MVGYSPASAGDMQLAHPRKRHHPWLIAIGAIILGSVILSALGAAQQPGTVRCVAPACAPGPPRQQTLSPPSHYTSSSYGYSLDYSTARINPSNSDSRSIAWDATLSDNSDVSWSFLGTSPRGRDTRQIVDALQQENFPDARYVYSIPGASIGYTPGYGNVYDLTVSPGSGSSVHDRLVVMVAIKRGVAVAFVGMGPYRATDPGSDSHPNPADTPLVDLGDVDESLTSVTWKGDPPL